MRLARFRSLVLLGVALVAAGPRATSADYAAMVAKAAGYFRAHQAPDGSFSGQSGPAVSALVAASLLGVGRSADDPVVAKALRYVEGFQQPDGGIYSPGSFHGNYETSIAVMAFARANRDGRYHDLLAKAEAYLKGIQWDAGENADPQDVNYGGGGYGHHKRPDLSNTAFLLEALQSLDRGASDEAVQRALVFVSRCQNFESEYNTTEFPAKNPDGGFYYTPAAGGTSQAGTTDNGGLRSYGSMTYAGLKSMIYAGVDKNDPRVAAAVDWIRKHYDVTQNPGLGDAGLFYYYQTFAKALQALGVDQLEDASGGKHDWRADLVAQLAKTQREDGSWVNANARWMEGDPNLVTAYALLALAPARP